MRQDDYLLALQKATREAGDISLETVRQIKAQTINRPAWAETLTKQQRLERHRYFLSTPLAMEEEYDAAAQRFNVPQGSVPRRWLEYGVLAHKELQAAEKEQGQ